MIPAIFLAACLQTGFDPTKLGIRNPGLERRQKVEAVRAATVAAPPRKSTPSPRRTRTVRRRVTAPAPKTVVAKAPAPKKMTPPAPPTFQAVVPIDLEQVPTDGPLPRMRWTWYVKSGKDFVRKRGGVVQLEEDSDVVLPALVAREGELRWEAVEGESGWEVAEGAASPLPSRLGQEPAPSGSWEQGRWIADPIVLRRNRVDVVLQNVPASAVVRFGEETLRHRPAGNGVVLSLPRDYAAANGAMLHIEHMESGATKAAEVELRNVLGPASPYRTFRANVFPHMWRLQGLPDIKMRGLELLDTVKPESVRLEKLVRSEQVFDAFGDPDSDEMEPGRRTFGVSDGSRLWTYNREGLEVKIRPLEMEDGTPWRIVEAVALMDAKAGSVAGLKVGDPMMLVVERLGRPDLSDGLRHQGSGYHGYLSGGLAFFEDVSSGKLVRIEIRRPLEFLRKGLVPTTLPDKASSRVVDIDYREGHVVLELPTGSRARRGSRFQLMNLDLPAVPKSLAEGTVLAQVERVSDGFATCKLVVERGRRFEDLSRADARRAVTYLLDPTMGFTIATLR